MDVAWHDDELVQADMGIMIRQAVPRRLDGSMAAGVLEVEGAIGCADRDKIDACTAIVVALEPNAPPRRDVGHWLSPLGVGGFETRPYHTAGPRVVEGV